jgi:hypothetical protein
VSLFVTPARLADGLEAKKSSADNSAAPRFNSNPEKHWFSRAALTASAFLI